MGGPGSGRRPTGRGKVRAWIRTERRRGRMARWAISGAHSGKKLKISEIRRIQSVRNQSAKAMRALRKEIRGMHKYSTRRVIYEANRSFSYGKYKNL